MEVTAPEKASDTKQKKKKKSNVTTNEDEINSKGKAKKKAPKKKAKNTEENSKGQEIIRTHDDGPDVFGFHDIANNKEASALIYDLVRCFTCNCTIPPKELDVFNKVLYEKTVSVFIHVLNNCIEKIFNKLVKGGFIDGKKVVTKDAYCQTDVSFGDT